MLRFNRGILWLSCFLASALAVSATTYVIDPVNGSPKGDGTAGHPWATLEQVMAAKRVWQGGDVLLLRTGQHGHPIVRGATAHGEVLIRADDGQKPQLGSIAFKAAAHWTVEGVAITPEGAPRPKAKPAALVTIAADCHDITVRRCDISSAPTAQGWTEADWLARSVNGITTAAPHTTIAENTLRNVRFGIVVGRSADHSAVSRNVIADFMSDGMRGLADDCVFEGNLVKNCYKIDDNHDDGFQSWSGGAGGVKVGGGVVKRVTLRGNTFISYTDPKQPFKSAMQGIGCFDGMFEGWIVENNVVVTDMWHGIAFYGAISCRIVNNTVIKNSIDAAPRTPWILVAPHKHGAPSHDNIVRNNLASTLKIPAGVGISDHNLEVHDPAAMFVDYRRFDFHLKPGCPAVDAGSADAAPMVDHDGNRRSGAIDLGAYEVTPAKVTAE